MKKLYTLTLSLFLFTLYSSACVETHPDSIRVSILVDSINCELLIEVSNLQMYGGDPNEFCSCGINSSITDLGQVSYVVFVDSTTNEPLAGFDIYELNALTGESWEEYDTEASFNWSGFISLVNASGLVAGQDVKLWIRLEAVEDSWVWAEFETNCDDENVLRQYLENSNASFGTDMWDPAIEELSDHHLSISKLVDENNSWVHTIVDAEVIEAMDQSIDDFFNSVEYIDAKNAISIYPNPVSNRVTITDIPSWAEGIRIFNSSGQLIKEYNINDEISVVDLNSGVYSVVLYGPKDRMVRRLVKN